MATKVKANGLNGVHTAGIYSDMTVDGPEIGTLVVIVDRAKNLPNRKTIGKQDPYCAARLGKEAKKTETDRRGGQTPRWDQELRYTVHDSPDYYQLKVSVFNDDKKTDLIGETWVSLQEVVVPGGGQNDLWHNLSYRGKYAGEIRIEITYYDTRPKQERSEKVKQGSTNVVEEEMLDSLKGPRQPKAPVKRRPLPSDPVTGAPAPVAIPDHVQTPPRGYQNQSSPYIPNQSPLQSVEYNTPPHLFSQSQGYGNGSGIRGYEARPGLIAVTPAAQAMPNDRCDIYDPMEMGDFVQESRVGHNRDEQESVDSNHRYASQHVYELPSPNQFGSPTSPGGPPPPPPAHGSRHGSQPVSPASAVASRASYGFRPDPRPTNPYNTPPNNMHRNSMPAYHQGSHQPYDWPSQADQFQNSADVNCYQQSPPRHHSYDSSYSSEHGSMQPTVEDAPPSPLADYSGYRSSGSRVSHYDDRRYDEVPSPAPLNLRSRTSNLSGHNSVSTSLSHQFSNTSHGYSSGNSPVSFRDHSQPGTSVSSRTSFSNLPPQPQQQRRQSEDQMAGSLGGFGMPSVPPTLVAGMDPVIAQEISDRIYHEKRASFSQSAGNSPRGRHQDSPLYQQNRPHPLSNQEEAPLSFTPAASTYDGRQYRYSAGPTAPIVKPRAISPDPRTPIRKSVSPSPSDSDGRRLSGVPFGPDAYDALNPTISGPKSPLSLDIQHSKSEVDPNAKIITHDGREVDPSDHIPESNYAPLLETNHPKYASQLPDRNYRAAPTGSQPILPSSHPPLRQAGRPKSMVTVSPTYMGSSAADPATPLSGRNRLQKKTNRMSTQAAPLSSPLAPISTYQDNSFIPRSLPRSNTGDFPNENYMSNNFGSSPGYRGSVVGPPLPAKVPINMNGAPPPQPVGGSAWALLEEMKNIDLGSGRARRRGY